MNKENVSTIDLKMCERLYTVKETAKILGCSSLTIKELIKKSKLKASKPYRRWIIKGEDIDNLIKNSVINIA